MTALKDQASPEAGVAGWYPDPLGSGKERYWDREWTSRIQVSAAPALPPVKSELVPQTPEQRKAQLAQRIANYVSSGCRVESQTDFQAVLVSGHRVNHVLHLILSVLTGGLWLIVWAIMGACGGEKHKVITIDEYGQALETKG